MTNATLTINNDIFNPSISVLKKVKFTKISLEFPKGFDAITDDEHKDLWPLLLQCNESSQWWIGDYLANCERTSIDQKTGREVKEMRVKLYEFMEETTGYSRSYLKQMKSVATRIPKDQRTSLSFGHHCDAVSGCNGDPLIMFRLLQDAEENQLSLTKFRSDMRQFMAMSGATRTTTKTSQSDKDFAELVSLVAKLGNLIKKNNLTTDQKDYLVPELEAIIESI